MRGGAGSAESKDGLHRGGCILCPRPFVAVRPSLSATTSSTPSRPAPLSSLPQSLKGQVHSSASDAFSYVCYLSSDAKRDDCKPERVTPSLPLIICPTTFFTDTFEKKWGPPSYFSLGTSLEARLFSVFPRFCLSSFLCLVFLKGFVAGPTGLFRFFCVRRLSCDVLRGRFRPERMYRP